MSARTRHRWLLAAAVVVGAGLLGARLVGDGRIGVLLDSWPAGAPSSSAGGAAPGTLGFVVTSLKTAGLETPYLEECPRGVAIGNDEIWWKSLSPRDRDRLTDGGEKEPSARRVTATLRGPRGEDVCWNPGVVRDPPLRTVESTRARGFDLDGTRDGEPTPRSCRHQKFTGLDGRTRVDNQMWRLVGCIHGWRANGYIENTADTERRNSSQGVLLIRVSGVRSLADSPEVRVTFHRSADVMPKDAAGGIIAHASYRIDGNPRYGAEARGRIRNGVLTTDPVDVRLPYFGNRVETEFLIRDLRLELKLTDRGASGLLGGYQDLDDWWSYVRRMGYLVETAQFSCPALHAAARALADGYPDPATGECTALSVAYDVEAVPAFVNLAPKPLDTPLTADSTALAGRDLPAALRSAPVRGAEVVTTARGEVVYVHADATSDCRRDCLRDRQPLRAAWGTTPRGEWSTRAMDDGTRQWLHRSRPVYTCARDATPGEPHCLGDGWKALALRSAPALPAGLTIQPSEMGPIVADRDGRSLYRLLGSRTDFEREICDAACIAATWRPALAPPSASAPAPALSRTAAQANATGSANAHGPASRFAVRQDGVARTWTFDGSPLYTFAGDEGPGQIAGHRFGGASVSAKNWFTVITVEEALR